MLFGIIRSVTCGSRVAAWVVRNDLCHNSALALYHAEDGGLADPAGAEMFPLVGVFVLFQPAECAFVHLNLARQFWPVIFIQHRTNLFAHTPRAFVGNADFPLKLLGANPASSRGHQVHGVKPEFQRSSRILKDRPAHWVFVMTAILARVGRSLAVAMMLCDGFAFGAEDAIGIEPFDEFLKTSCIVWIISLEIHERVSTVGRPGTYRLIAVDLAHVEHSTKGAHLRQRDSYKRTRS